MKTDFEPTPSFCYRFARYELLDEIAREPEAVSLLPFKLLDVQKRVIERHLTTQQLETRVATTNADKNETVYSTLKFYVGHVAKHLPASPLVWRGNGGMFQLKSDAELQQEIEEIELEIEDEDETVEFEGWIYAFSFPALVKESEAFPIKIGRTFKDVEKRVKFQCKGSAAFDNPTILDRWKVKRARAVESAIHSTLKSRSKWRENVPGTEWFDTTIGEIDAIVRFVTQQ